MGPINFSLLLLVLIREIFRVLDLMKLDNVNGTIEILRPLLQRNGVEYQRQLFQSILDDLPGELKKIGWIILNFVKQTHHKVVTKTLLVFQLL